MKQFSSLLCSVFCLLSMLAVSPLRADTVVTHGDWKITYVEASQSFKVNYMKSDGSGYRPVFIGSQPVATYDNAAGEARTVSSASFAQTDYTTTALADTFGVGTCHIFTFSQPDNGDDVTLRQRFYFYDEQDYIFTDLVLSGDASIRSNYLAPISTTSTYTLFLNDANNRMLKVPFDNDGFTRYHKYTIGRDMTSYEATVLFEGTIGDGLVVGSVEHDHWKSAIAVSGADNGAIKSIRIFSGVADSETRDVLPHGKRVGPTIASAKMLIGFFDDWRLGMETYAHANTMVQPMRSTWTGGTPFGWQSWGVMAEYNSYDTDVAISNYFKEVLNPAGFCNDQGLNIISIDAWDNLSYQQKVSLAAVCKANGQVLGTYASPFALWWNEDMLDNKLDGQTFYTARQCVIKVNGEPYKLDGAYCLDPTHPGVKANIAYQIRTMKAQGFGYVKIDFTSNGMVQADSYYNPAVTTAVEAYNEGFSYFIKKADEGTPLFVALSIAPIFPYQYGNSRRIACDTWGKIGQSEYSLNAISGGWWTNQFYQYNDPDHLVFVGNDKVKETIGENRARMTNGAISGMVMVADNYSLDDKSGRGNATLSRSRAEQILMNIDVNAVARLGRSFRPVYGYKEYNGSDGGAENFFVHQTDEYLYLAIVNYRASTLWGYLPLSDLGLAESDYDAVKELWNGETVMPENGRLNYSVPERDAAIYRFHKTSTGLHGVAQTDRADVLTVRMVGADRISLTAISPMQSVVLYDVQGQCLSKTPLHETVSAICAAPTAESMIIARVLMSDGSIRVCKVAR